MGGAVVIEVIFNLPGMGTAILRAFRGGEIELLVQGVNIVVASLSFIIINIVADMLYLSTRAELGHTKIRREYRARGGGLKGVGSSVA